jgi:hypothetical protein
MRGKDDQIHSTTLEASSLFDAAHKAIERWALLWWFSSKEPITVQHGEDRWRVTPERVRVWRESRTKRG